MKKTLILALALLALSGCKAPHYWKGADIGWATEYESRGHVEIPLESDPVVVL